MSLSDYLIVSAEVSNAAAPVALETTAIAHGLPYPQNLDVAQRLESAVRNAGATPAWCGILDGRMRAGFSPDEVQFFAENPDLAKVSRRDFAPLMAAGQSGATTVAGTMICAHAAGIRLFATGGLGGVHRQVSESMDISADITELARTPVTVVCSGAKSILDLPKTVEALETAGVPVLGYGVDHFPAFQVHSSGLPVDRRVNDAGEAATMVRMQASLGLGGMVIGVPVPASEALDATEVEAWVTQALQAAEREGVRGKRITPFLLKHLAELSGGKTLSANIALLENNALVAGKIATALAGLES